MPHAGPPGAGRSGGPSDGAAIAGGLLLLALLTAAGWRVYGAGDFRYFYQTADVWRATGHYVPQVAERANLNLPHVAVAFVPLTALPLPAAWLAWQAVNVAALGLLWRLLPVRPGRLLTVLLCLTPAVLSQVALSQVAALLAVLVTAAWLETRRGRWLSAGVALGLAIAMKPFLVPVACWLAVSRAGRVAGTALATAGALTLVGVRLLSPAAYVTWLDAARSASWAVFELNVSLFGWLARVGLGDSPVPWLTVCALVGGVTAWSAWGRLDAPAWVAVLAATVLLSPLGWAYYELILLGPLLLAVSRQSALGRVAWGLWVPPALGFASVTGASLALLAVWAVAARLSSQIPADQALGVATHG